MKLPGFLPDFSVIREKLSEYFFFSEREKNIALIIAGGAAAAAVAAAVIIVVSGGISGRRANKAAEELFTEKQYLDKSAYETPFLSEFILPENQLEESLTGVIYSREPAERWTEEQVDKFWIDPKDIAVDLLERESEKVVRDIFADVP